MTENDQKFDDISKPEEKKVQNRNRGGGLQSAIRVISCLPCFPKYEPKPDTPNIDQVNSFFIIKKHFFIF